MKKNKTHQEWFNYNHWLFEKYRNKKESNEEFKYWNDEWNKKSI